MWLREVLRSLKAASSPLCFWVCLTVSLLNSSPADCDDFMSVYEFQGDAQQLNFVSEEKLFAFADIELKLRSDWLIMNAEISAAQRLRVNLASALALSKISVNKDSSLFLDNKGRLNLEDGDDFSAQCSYSASLELTKSAGAQFFFLTINGEAYAARENAIAILANGPAFAVTEATNLEQLQNFCQQNFESNLKARVLADLRLAAESKMRLKRLEDPRLIALQQALEGKASEVRWKTYRWRLSAPQIEADAEHTHIKFAVQSHSAFADQTYQAEFTYDSAAKPKLRKAQVLPLEVGSEFTELQVLASFLSRHIALWQRSGATSLNNFVIDTSLLTP